MLNVDSNLTSEDQIASKKFNEYFTKIPIELSPSTDIDVSITTNFFKNDVTFFFKLVDELLELIHVIGNIKYHICVGLIILCKCDGKNIDFIERILLKFINISLTNGVFSENLKMRKIMPILQKEDKTILQN